MMWSESRRLLIVAIRTGGIEEDNFFLIVPWGKGVSVSSSQEPALDLADEVYDCGDSLDPQWRQGGTIPLSNIMNVNSSVQVTRLVSLSARRQVSSERDHICAGQALFVQSLRQI